jgi:hypothetical protein
MRRRSRHSIRAERSRFKAAKKIDGKVNSLLEIERPQNAATPNDDR